MATSTAATAGSPSPRVVSLLPSATEILCAIQGGPLMVGRSHECDFPGSITGLPMLTGQVHEFVSSRQMNDAVSESLAAGKGLYTIDSPVLEGLRPDVILTQSLCNVCSVDLCMVERIAGNLQPSPTIMSLNPHSLQDLMDDMQRVGEAVGLVSEAARAVDAMRARIRRCHDVVQASCQPERRPTKVAFVEWLDPIFVGGHWTPALIEMAGGSHLLNTPSGSGLAAAAGKSFAVPSSKLVDTDPDVILVCPCGLDLKATWKEASAMFKSGWWRGLRAVQEGRVALVDGNQMFNRPGPRLVDALEFLTGLLNDRPDVIPQGFPWEWWSAAAHGAVNPGGVKDHEAALAEKDSAGAAGPLTPHPFLDRDIEDAYEGAISAKAASYTDPATGYSVFTDFPLLARGYCCGNRCRHCPYGHFNVDEAVRGPRLNRITASVHLKPQRRHVGLSPTLLIWLGGLESHLQLTALLKHKGVDAQDIVLVVATELSASQHVWGNPHIPVHDALEQSKKLGMHMVVVPIDLGEGFDGSGHGPGRAPCLQVLQVAAKLLGLEAARCSVASPVRLLPLFGRSPRSPERTWEEEVRSLEGTATLSGYDAAGMRQLWEVLMQECWSYSPLRGDEQSPEAKVAVEVLHSSFPDVAAGRLQPGTALPWDPLGKAITDGPSLAFASKVLYLAERVG